MKSFKYSIKTVYPPMPELRILFTKNNIKMRYGYQNFYITKNEKYQNNISFSDLENLEIPKSKVETDIIMIDGWREKIYIDSEFIMDLALFDREREVVNHLLSQLFDGDIYDYYNKKYLEFIRDNNNLFS